MAGGRARQTRETYAELVKVFRQKPGNFRAASQALGVSRGFVRKAWDEGWGRFDWAPPIKTFIVAVPERETLDPEVRTAVEVIDGAQGRQTVLQQSHDAETLSQVLKAHSTGSVDIEAIRRDVATVRVLDAIAARHATRSGAMLLEKIGEATKAAAQLSEALAVRIEALAADPDTKPDTIVGLLERLVSLQERAVNGYERAHELSQLCLGEGDSAGDKVPELTVEEAIHITRTASAAAERAYAQLQRESKHAEPNQ